MKPHLIFLALAVLPFLPDASAGAEDPTPDYYVTHFANIVGIISAGGADWYVSYPTNVQTTGTYHIAVSTSTTAAATTSISMTAGSFQGSGCSIGTFVLDSSGTSQASGYLPVTVTDPYCFGSVRFAITSGASALTAIRASFQIAADTVTTTVAAWPTLNVAQSGAWTLTDDANGWAIHQDPLSGSLQLCGQSGTCGPLDLRGELFNGNVTDNSNTTTTLGLSLPVLDEWIPLAFFALVFVAAGFIPYAPARLTLMALAVAGIFASWLNAPGFGVRGVVALLGAIGIGYAGIVTWRNREPGDKSPGTM